MAETFILILCGILGFQFITIIDRIWLMVKITKQTQYQHKRSNLIFRVLFLVCGDGGTQWTDKR